MKVTHSKWPVQVHDGQRVFTRAGMHQQDEDLAQKNVRVALAFGRCCTHKGYYGINKNTRTYPL